MSFFTAGVLFKLLQCYYTRSVTSYLWFKLIGHIGFQIGVFQNAHLLDEVESSFAMTMTTEKTTAVMRDVPCRPGARLYCGGLCSEGRWSTSTTGISTRGFYFLKAVPGLFLVNSILRRSSYSASALFCSLNDRHSCALSKIYCCSKNKLKDIDLKERGTTHAKT
ncbi:hypothetical protein Droror1_Dr00004530 [Drosera rotundifolia]